MVETPILYGWRCYSQPLEIDDKSNQLRGETRQRMGDRHRMEENNVDCRLI